MELERQTRALEDTVGALELTWRRVLRVEGDDARSWLNGVVTQDLREPHGQTLRHALFVDVRGRVLADASVIEHASGAFDLLIPAEVASAVIWLCLPANRSITGQAIAVAGGEVM